MPSYKSIEIDCPICDLHDQLIERTADVENGVRCDRCGEVSDVVISAPALRTINPGNSDFNERQTARLDKRASDHTKTKGYQEEKVWRTRQQLGAVLGKD